MVTTYDLLRRAILERRQVRAVYHRLPREFCPHVLGAKGDKQHCLGYQFGGRTSSGAVVPGSTGNWRCFEVDELSEVSIQEGPWFTAANWDRRQTCVERIDVEVTQGSGPGR